MPRVARVPRRDRVQAIGLTLLAHAFLLMLISVQSRVARDQLAPELQYVSLWSSLLQKSPVRTENAERHAAQDALARNSRRSVRSMGKVLGRVVPEPIQQVDARESASSDVKSQTDWNAAARNAAARVRDDAIPQDSFTAAPQLLRKPCKARVFDAETKELMDERLPPLADPDAVGADPKANCIKEGGTPKCVQKLVVRGRKRGFDVDLFKHRVEGKQPASSVPSPEICD
jgi:hypothetical protein